MMRSHVARGQEQLARIAELIRGLDPATLWRITIGPHRSKRSTDQNKLLWATLTAISQGTGHTPQEVHEALKKLLLPPRQIVLGEVRVPVAGSTAALDVAAFGDYVEQVRAWAASQGINVEDDHG